MKQENSSRSGWDERKATRSDLGLLRDNGGPTWTMALLPGSPAIWRSDQEAEIMATTIPLSNDRESAIVRDLAPGNYTAIVREMNNTTGIAVVEAFALN